ncbi:Uncharacterised protein [Mycoplasmopsis bovigenitalium]|uniref:Uncharacterized protein n=1 Tax=Mycoplasmopsis bovigenitalium TaxID=2112 RepID=A0A449A9C7_9BACT|nr:Uncharacterised protein [Mycoplasmopsis bovigenitalium]
MICLLKLLKIILIISAVEKLIVNQKTSVNSQCKMRQDLLLGAFYFKDE